MEDGDYSDDDFADINENALQVLEQSALVSTQRPRTATAAGPLTVSAQGLRKQNGDAASLNRPGNSNGRRDLPWQLPQPQAQVQESSQFFQSRPNAQPLDAPDPPSSDYGLDDENVIDLDEQTRTGAAASTIPYQQPVVPRHGSKALLDEETRAAFAAADAEMELTESRVSQHGLGATLDVVTLQARIAVLEAEQDRLRRSEQNARDLAQAKQGEIRIVRSKLDNSAKTYEGRIAALQKQHRDEVAKHKAELEAGQKEREQMQTDNRFLQHDLAQEAERAKRVTGASRSRTTAPSGRNETPKKTKRAGNGIGDGFDEDEVNMISPSRSKDKSREQTPKAGIKRKRTGQDSPARLSFTQPPTSIRNEDSVQTEASLAPVYSLHMAQSDAISEHYTKILNHRPYGEAERTLEILSKFTFPSTPDKSIATIFLDKILGPVPPEKEDFLVKVSMGLLELWSKCLDDQHFGPFYLILDMLESILDRERSSLATHLLEPALPLCFRTIDLIAIDNAASSLYGSGYVASADPETRTRLMEEVDVERVLDFMYDICQAAALSSESLLAFWKLVEHDFMLVMLNQAHPISQITTSLKMLSTSAMETSFGCIAADASRQTRHENDVVNKVTSLLFESPIPQKDEPPYTIVEMTELRIEVLEVLKSMCQTHHGGLLLAQHRSAIGRLVRFLEGQVRKLYSTLPSIGLPRESDDAQAHQLVVTTINMTTRLLYHLLRTHDGAIDIVQKLRAVLGGYHKFVVSLSRIAFTEQLAFEAGIEDAAADAAHAILDHVLGPDDGEAVMKAVETPRSGGAQSLLPIRDGRSESQSEAG